MSANSAQRQDEPVRDEWGIFDPRRAGVPAVMDALRSEATGDPAKTTPSPAATSPASPPHEAVDATNAAQATARAQSGAGALHTLAAPVQCPQCEQEIRTLRGLRLLRPQAPLP